MIFDGKMARLQAVHLRLGQVLEIGFAASRGEEDITLPPEDNGLLACGRGPQLGDVRARQQDRLHIQCPTRLGNGCRHSGHEGARRHTRW